MRAQDVANTQGRPGTGGNDSAWTRVDRKEDGVETREGDLQQHAKPVPADVGVPAGGRGR